MKYEQLDAICLNCHEPIMYGEGSSGGGWCHKWGRWDGDNGFYCNQHSNQHANPNTREFQDFIDKGFCMFFYKEGKYMVKNINTGEVIEDPFEGKKTTTIQQPVKDLQKSDT